jgi:hypothetical protein
LSFTAEYNDIDAVDLKWTTASEINNDYFTVERSADAVDFTDLIFKDGAGNSSQIITYNDIDRSPLNGKSYYRLKQTDFDGQFSYSNVVPVDINKSEFEIVNTFNSTDQGVLEVSVNCSNNCIVNIELYDVIGKKIFSSLESVSGSGLKILIPSGQLNKGMYLIKAINNNTVISKKIIL